MRKPPLFGRSRLTRIAAVILPLLLPAAAWSGGHGARIEGLWNVEVTIYVCGTDVEITRFEAMGLFAADGTFHDTNANDPKLRSAGFGTWKHLGGRSYRFAFRLFRFDSMGMTIGSQIVRHRVELSRRGSSYRSFGTAEYYDTAGNLERIGCSRSTAVRFR